MPSKPCFLSSLSRWSVSRWFALSVVFALSACGGGGGGGDIDSDSDSEPLAEVIEPEPLVITDIKLPEARNLLPSLARYEPAFEGEFHSGSAECSSCHTDPELMTVQGDAPGELKDVSIGTAWETSVMAQATRDPYWHAVVASELDNFPMLEDVINDKCLVCHAPTAHDLASKTPNLDLRLFDKVDEQTGEVSAQGIYTMDASNELFNHAMDGVTCTLCHQMEDTNFGTDEGMSGNFTIVGAPGNDPSERPAYGQYADPSPVAYMRNNSGFLPLHGPHLSTSESCATCHNLNIESVDLDGNLIESDSHFAEQAVYTEWLKSDFAVGGPLEASCQDCHMPVLDQEVYIGEGADRKRPDFAEHTFLGANTVMQDMFKNFADELGIDPDLDFDSSILRNREFLKTSADVTVSQRDIGNDRLNFDVLIENKTGHKLPSGYHSRRVYLHVQVLDENNELMFESGRMRDDGSIVGVSEDVNPATWESHYDVITSETQVQVYQAITGDVNGDRTHSLLAAANYLKDNRLTPIGFDKDVVASDTTLPDSFGTFGQAASDNNFNNGRDTVSYRVAVPDELKGQLFTVIAELRYQPLSYGHLIKLWTQGDRVDQVDMFRTIYEATELRDESIASDILMMR